VGGETKKRSAIHKGLGDGANRCRITVQQWKKIRKVTQKGGGYSTCVREKNIGGGKEATLTQNSYRQNLVEEKRKSWPQRKGKGQFSVEAKGREHIHEVSKTQSSAQGEKSRRKTGGKGKVEQQEQRPWEKPLRTGQALQLKIVGACSDVERTQKGRNYQREVGETLLGEVQAIFWFAWGD